MQKRSFEISMLGSRNGLISLTEVVLQLLTFVLIFVLSTQRNVPCQQLCLLKCRGNSIATIIFFTKKRDSKYVSKRR